MRFYAIYVIRMFVKVVKHMGPRYRYGKPNHYPSQNAGVLSFQKWIFLTIGIVAKLVKALKYGNPIMSGVVTHRHQG